MSDTSMCHGISSQHPICSGLGYISYEPARSSSRRGIKISWSPRLIGPCCWAPWKDPYRKKLGRVPTRLVFDRHCQQQTITGMQELGVQACTKHFIGNEQEKNRDTVSANIDDRTMHELYLWPSADAVKASVASVVCSYNKVNSTYACENGKLMNGL